MSYYLKPAIVQFYYREIKKTGSLENAVDNFWNNILPQYFTQAKSYGIEYEARVLAQYVKQRADFTIRCVKNGVPKKIVLLENKRREFESHTAKWQEAVDQLTNYLKLVRTEQGGGEKLYGAVCIGTFVRFYILMPGEGTLRDFVAGGQLFELAANEKEIHNILNVLVQKTQ